MAGREGTPWTSSNRAARSSGIELGSTRIKAALIAPDTTPLASGSHAWENRLRDGVWTYDLADVWTGLAAPTRRSSRTCARATAWSCGRSPPSGSAG